MIGGGGKRGQRWPGTPGMDEQGMGSTQNHGGVMGGPGMG